MAENAQLRLTQSHAFMWLLGLAYAGAFVSFEPFLYILLPIKISYLNPHHNAALLSEISMVAAIAASIANIAFGWASDVIGSRRKWISAGIIFLTISYFFLFAARTSAALLITVIFWEAAVNMVFAPLMAWSAETIPSTQKGLLSGLMSGAPPIAALGSVLVTAPFIHVDTERYALIWIIVCVAILPLLVLGRPQSVSIELIPEKIQQPQQSNLNITKIWAARLFAQTANITVSIYMIYYIQQLHIITNAAHFVARLMFAGQILGLPVAFVFGSLSDRFRMLQPFVFATLFFMFIGLLFCLIGNSLIHVTLGLIGFMSASSAFASLHAVYAMEHLPTPQRRGRDLGILNLTNTIPSILAPFFAIYTINYFGYSGLFITLLFLVIFAGALIASTDQKRIFHS